MAPFGLFGGDPVERALKDIEKKICDPCREMILKYSEEFGVENKDMWMGATSAMTMSRCINEFSTHYVRTKLTMHPKWTTEGNFKDMSMPLCMSIAMHFRIMNRSTYPLHRIKQVISTTLGTMEGGPSFELLIRDMWKNAPLESLAEHYPRETNEALDVLETMHKSYSMASAHEFPHEYFSTFINGLKITYF